MLAVQTCLGFLLTAHHRAGAGGAGVTRLGFACLVLVPGPFLGAWAMWRLRPHLRPLS
jgi:hypothetical protein